MLMIPKTRLSGITKAIIMAYTGSLAEQVVKGVTNMVISRSFQFSMFRVAIIAGIAQAVPEIRGTTLFPDKPNFRMILSIRKTTRLMYPLSSKTEINKNKKAICGINIKIPPIPGIIPCEIKLVKTPGGNSSPAKELKEANVLSIKSIGIFDHSKMD
ncbi:hypothetical protein D3C87_1395520 [compost metagenome]